MSISISFFGGDHYLRELPRLYDDSFDESRLDTIVGDIRCVPELCRSGLAIMTIRAGFLRSDGRPGKEYIMHRINPMCSL